jgi:hypothetical protein
MLPTPFRFVNPVSRFLERAALLQIHCAGAPIAIQGLQRLWLARGVPAVLETGTAQLDRAAHSKENGDMTDVPDG